MKLHPSDLGYFAGALTLGGLQQISDGFSMGIILIALAFFLYVKGRFID